MLLEGHIKRLFLQFLFTSFEMRLDRVVRPQASALPPFCPKHLVQSQFSLSVLSDSWQLHGLQHTRPHCPSPTPRAYPNSHSLRQWCHTTISSSCHPLLLPLQSFPASGLFQWVNFLHQVAKVLEFQLQHQSFQWIFRTDFLQDWLVGSPCSPRDSPESLPTPQFKSINFSVLSFLYTPILTSIHDYWKKPQLWLDGPLLAM